MEIRAYDEEYLRWAMRILGDAVDYAVYSCEMDADRFFGMFLVSGIAKQFENGNPTYVAGMTGCELVKKVIWMCTNRRNIGRGGQLPIISGIPGGLFQGSIRLCQCRKFCICIPRFMRQIL